MGTLFAIFLDFPDNLNVKEKLLIGLLTSKGYRCVQFSPPPTLHGKIKPDKGKGGGADLQIWKRAKSLHSTNRWCKTLHKLGGGCIWTLNLNNFR